MRRFHVGQPTVWIVLAAIVSGCQQPSSGIQAQPAVTQLLVNTPTPQPLEPTPLPQGPTPTTKLGGYAPGSIIINQTFALDAAQPSAQTSEFEAVAGQIVRVEATRQDTSLDYTLSLIDKFGTALATVDSAPGSISEIISEIRLPYDGVYGVTASPVSGRGTIQTSVTALETASGGGSFDALPISSEAEMSAVGTHHIYQFQLARGDTISVVASSAVRPLLRLDLIGPDGRIAGTSATPSTSDAALHGFVVPATGTYLAIVGNVGDGTGPYHFSVTSDVILPTPEGGADIGYDQVYRANFSDQSTLAVTFDGVIGDILKIDIIDPPAKLDIDVYLFSPYDHIIAFAVDAPAGQGEHLNEIQLPYSGRYRLELRPRGVGEAAFSVSRLPIESLSGGGIFGNQPSGIYSGNFTAPNTFHVYQFSASPDEVVSIAALIPEDSPLALGMALISPAGQELAFVDDSTAVGASLRLDQFSLRQTGLYTVIIYTLNGASGTYDLSFERVN